jgi:secernin
MCDSFVATGLNTASGSTLFAKNSDRHLLEAQPFLQNPAAYHPRGAELRCTHITIPEVAETYRVMGHSPWWIWGFEQGVNEYGVAIGNQAVFTREPVEEEPGLIGMDLVRLGLERGRDAREALEVIAGLIEQHGQGGSGFGPGESGYHNSFMLADPEQAWVLETSRRHWAARRLDLDSLSNHLTLTDNWGIGSRDLETFARTEGLWTTRGRVNVSNAYRERAVPGHISEGRLRRSQSLLAAGRGKHDMASMRDLLRDHGADGALPPVDVSTDNEERFTLCMHAEPVGTTTASMIAALPTDRTVPWPVWISFSSPCAGIFIPVYIDGVLPASLARGAGDPSQAEGDSAWWVFHRLSEVVARDFSRALPVVRAHWRETEEHIERERAVVEAEARTLASAGERVEAMGILSDFMSRVVGEVLETADRLRESLEG